MSLFEHCMHSVALLSKHRLALAFRFPLHSTAAMSRQTSLLEFCYRYNDVSRSRSPCPLHGINSRGDDISVHSSSDVDVLNSSAEQAPSDTPAQQAVD